MKKYLFLLFCTISLFAFAQLELNTNDVLVKTTYYNDSIPAIKRWFGDDKKIDSLKTYYKSGVLNEDFHFTHDVLNGFSYQFNKIEEKLTTWEFQNGKLLKRTDHKIEFNTKTEKKVKIAHEGLIELNNKQENTTTFNFVFLRAKLRYQLGNYTLALEDLKQLEKFLEKNINKHDIPDKIRGSIYDLLASIYSEYEMENNTIHYKIKAINASPKESRLYYNLGAYLVREKQYRLGIVYLQKAIDMVPNHSFANWGLAVAYSDLEDYKKALTSVNIAFKNIANLYKRGQGTSERDLWTTRGFIYHKLGESEKGIADLEKALKIDNNNAFAYRNLGVIYHDLGNYEKSCEYLKKAKELGYEQIYDRYDLEDYLEHSCFNKFTQYEVEKSFNRPYVYPNPANDVLNIYHFNPDNFNYNIYNFEALLVKKGVSEGKSIDITDLIPGLYILSIEANELIQSFKIIKE